MTEATLHIRIAPVGSDDWRAVARLEALPEQERFVAAPSYYLALCAYGALGFEETGEMEDDEVVARTTWTER